MSDIFTIVILVCAVDLAPQDCSAENAIDVISGPSAPNEMACARDGFAYVAQTPFVALDESYPKVLCSRAAPMSGDIGASAEAPTRAASAGPAER